MPKWFVTAKRADFEAIASKFHISPVTARIIRNRDIITDEQIDHFLNGDTLYNPLLLMGLTDVVDILIRKIWEKKHIRVIGDYDADGICSTYILKKGLQMCHAIVDTAIPDRIKDGYGLNENLVRAALSDGVDTIITCDNGIAAEAQVRFAKESGMTVIITDHHEVPYEDNGNDKQYIIPQADVVVDPKQPGDLYPYREICGAVVAFKLIQEMFRRYGLDPVGKGGTLDELLELAAFATICDVMPLLDENRVIVKKGLSMMRHSRNAGLRALMAVNGIDPLNGITAYHIGFILGPCINATGRLTTAEDALSLLEAGSDATADSIAKKLKQVNDERKELTEKFLEEACRLIENSSIKEDKVLVVFLPTCHESVAGIIAGRLRERYYRPAIVLTRGSDGIVKGSARSIEGYDIFAEMTKCRDVFLKFGGHKMAAGLSMKEGEIAKLRSRLNVNCTLGTADFVEKVHIDVPMPVSYVSFSLTVELSLLEPFGTANPRPLFAQKSVEFISAKILGKNKNVLKFNIKDERGTLWDMMYFGNVEAFNAYIRSKYGDTALNSLYKGNGNIRMDVAYYPQRNDFNGNISLQLVMKNYN